MQIFHLNLFFAGQEFSTPYMADDLDLFVRPCKNNAVGLILDYRVSMTDSTSEYTVPNES